MQIDDFRKLDEATKTAKKVVIIGGGFLGSELACALAHRGKLLFSSIRKICSGILRISGKSNGMEVHQVYPEKGNLARILPEYLSEWTTRKLQIGIVRGITGRLR